VSDETLQNQDRQNEDTGHEAPPVNILRICENGPLELSAEFSIAGERYRRAALCRCGASNNKPWCDGSHARVGFVATGEPPVRESEPLAGHGGPLLVVPVENGPLRMEGPLEVCSATGRTVDRSRKTWLCRCGMSGNKPWCDGTHKRTGFEAAGETPRRK
jgi:CDGSH-type Zn-finger protein